MALEESIGNTLFDIRKGILDMFPQSKDTKAKISKWYYIKLKSFSTEGNYQQNKDNLLNGEDIQ